MTDRPYPELDAVLWAGRHVEHDSLEAEALVDLSDLDRLALHCRCCGAVLDWQIEEDNVCWLCAAEAECPDVGQMLHGATFEPGMANGLHQAAATAAQGVCLPESTAGVPRSVLGPSCAISCPAPWKE
jgi:hypothetical protein